VSERPGLRQRLSNLLADLDRKRPFRIAVAAAFIVGCLAAASVYYLEGARIAALQERLPPILEKADLSAKDAVATQLVERGTVTVDGVEIGNAVLAQRMARMFEATGRLERPYDAAALLLSTERKDWMPAPFAENPGLALAGGAIGGLVALAACTTGLSVALVGLALASGAIAAFLSLIGRPAFAPNLIGIPVLLFVFALVVRLLLALFNQPTPMFAVAGSVIREAMRLRIAVVFAGIAIVAIPLLPQFIDPDTPLRYQVQTFLSRSLDTMYLVCSLLTVFLGCATVAFEIRDRQAWTTLTKPVSRMSWLAGKWLGIVGLNAAILSTCTLAMGAYLVQLRARPAQDIYDFIAIDSEVLAARIGSLPEYSLLSPDEVQARVESEMKSDPNIQADLRDGARSEIEIKQTLAKAILEKNLASQRTIGPNLEKVYRFSGLERGQAGETLTLRYKFYAGESDPNELYPVVFLFGTGDRQQWTDANFIAAQSNVVSVPASAIDDSGVLEVRIQNLRFNPNARDGEPPFTPGSGTIYFDPDGFELLHRVGGFADNLLRAQLVNILKLSFLGMLSVVFASILSFPVACLIVFTALSAGSIGGFLGTSITEYRIRTDSDAVKLFEGTVKAIAGATEFTLRAYSQAKANGPLVEGRLVSWWDVGRTFLLIGVGWSGLLLLGGFALFRRKELAIYSGQGG
jgi:ABC-type transport system involved in multi-copper enzyme maturation permease subunit